MADWKKQYKDHLISMEEAAKKIVPGDVIWMGQVNQIPYAFLDEMHAHMTEPEYDYHDIEIIYNCSNYPYNFLFDPETKKHFHIWSLYNLPLERMSIEMGILDSSGVNYDQMEKGGYVNGINAYALQVMPPDEEGYCNVGAYGVCANTVIVNKEYIKKKIGFINSTGMFTVPGSREDTCIHISEFDYIVENDADFMAVPAPEPGEVDKKMAAFILPYLKEGDYVEIGYGGLGEEILANLRDIGKMNVFTEVACDNMAGLCEEGVIESITATSPGACSERFFHFLQNTTKARLHPTTYSINPLEIMKVDNIVAINVTFMVDLLGQACSEAQGLMPYSGTGGSFAYIWGATLAKNGRSFLCLRSTYVDKQGVTRSNVVPWLPEGSIVTTPKNFVMYVVSEWGLADVYLKTLKRRIKALIQIAHPDFRQELKEKICTTPLISEDDFDD